MHICENSHTRTYYTYVRRPRSAGDKLVENEEIKGETQQTIKTDSIHDVSRIDQSSGENKQYFNVHIYICVY